MSEPTSALCVVCPVLRPPCPDGCPSRRPDGCLKHDPRRPRDKPVCDSCRGRTRDSLLDIPELFVRAYANRFPGRPGDQPLSAVFESRLPSSLAVLNMVGPGASALTAHGRRLVSDQLGPMPPLVVLGGWAQDWARVRAQREAGGLVGNLRSLVDWLADRLDWAFASYVRVGEFAGEVTAMRGWLRGMAGVKPLRHELSAPCPTCELVGLYRDDGNDFVECGNCHRLWTEEEYRFLTRILAEELGKTPAVGGSGH